MPVVSEAGKISGVTLPEPVVPEAADAAVCWYELHGSSQALLIARAAQQHSGLVLVITPDSHMALHLEAELAFFCKDGDISVFVFPDWETLPYDVFSPQQDIVAQRLSTLYRLPQQSQGILIVPVSTLMQRLLPRNYLESHALMLSPGETLDQDQFRLRLEAAGYVYVSQVNDYGEFAIRGSLIDLFPAGSDTPYRIDLFDDEIESIRTFDPETQRSISKVDSINLLPAREFPLDKEATTRFRQAFRTEFDVDPQNSPVYRDVSQGIAPGGIEYYLPLFFDTTSVLFDYLPQQTLLVELEGVTEALSQFEAQVAERFEQRRYDVERPLLPPAHLFLGADQITRSLADYPLVMIRTKAIPETRTATVVPLQQSVAYNTLPPPDLSLNARADDPAAALHRFLQDFTGRVLFAAESPGRREALLETLRGYDIRLTVCEDWPAFLQSEFDAAHGPVITVAPLEQGLVLDDLAIISEAQLYGERVRQARRRTSNRDADNVIRNLSELAVGAPVVHEEHGVGRYAGLQFLTAAGIETEFVVLEYAGADRLYVPVASLHLISRYTGASPELAPLHRLGSEQWSKAKRRAAEKVRDVAAELLEIYARREVRSGHTFALNDSDYAAFAAAFPFEETPDQQAAIESVISNMRASKPMDRIVCGDVGFGKTEVAMRAAFVSVQDGRQVAILVPTTLLAQQHFQNFQDRFADWPVNIELLSRFRTGKQQAQALTALKEGRVDILIGTHKIIQDSVSFKNLGLVIIDEEHRFGVRHKERLKALRSEVDVLTLTATPIPRTLNMSLAGLRDLSIIVTPPAGRLAVKTFVSEWNKSLIEEACQRELKRGGQVYFLHNEVASIERQARELENILPQARIAIAHGQMRERELEQVMLDFYHLRCNVLVCTTIIESGIDVPSANTIIINRADRLGLAQLHQLRGRVGRSHHRAYAYLIVPHRKSMTADAVKRIDAIESLEDLGAGFMLANHDLEIRGAGELLGDDQSGQIHEIGFSLYMEMLERAVAALKAGRTPELDRPLDHGPEVDLQVPALIPEDYLPDVHNRLLLYKRIASATGEYELNELQVEIIDRFGLLPQPLKNLFALTRLKLIATPLGVKKIEASARGGRIVFNPEPAIDVGKLIGLIQSDPLIYKLDGQEKLRFSKPLEDITSRMSEVEGLLSHLAMSAAAT